MVGTDHASVEQLGGDGRRGSAGRWHMASRKGAARRHSCPKQTKVIGIGTMNHVARSLAPTPQRRPQVDDVVTGNRWPVVARSTASWPIPGELGSRMRISGRSSTTVSHDRLICLRGAPGRRDPVLSGRPVAPDPPPPIGRLGTVRVSASALGITGVRSASKAPRPRPADSKNRIKP